MILNCWELLFRHAHCVKSVRTEYGKILYSLHSVQMRENTDQNNSEYGNFLRSVGSDKFSDIKVMMT